MLLSAIIDPSVFDSTILDKELPAIQALDLLGGLRTRGILLVDEDASLLSLIKEGILGSKSASAKKMAILLEEMWKNGGEKIVRLRVSPKTQKRDPANINCHCSSTAYALNRAIHPDAFVVGPGCGSGCDQSAFSCACLDIQQYIGSAFYEKIQKCQDHVAIDKITDADFEDLIARAARLSPWLRFYDKIIGKADNLEPFRDGMDAILSIWSKKHFMGGQSDRSVEIITVSREKLRRNDPLENQKRKSIGISAKKIIADLIEPLQTKHQVKIILHLKEDRQSMFHDRFLESKQAVLEFERGFDLFGYEGKRRKNFVSMANNLRMELAEIYNLPSIGF